MADIQQLLQMIKGSREIRTPQPRRPGFDPRMLQDDAIDPSLRVHAGNDAMQGELRNRIFQAQRSQGPSPNATSPHEVNALKGLLGSHEDEQAASPIALQQKEYDIQRQGNLTAQNQGFPGGEGQSPMQARELYRRQQEREKLMQPIEERKMMEAGENFRQGRQIDATQRMVDTQMEPSRQFYENQARILEGGVDPNQIKSVTKSGTTFQTQQRPNTAGADQLRRRLADARNALGDAGVGDPFADLHGSGGPQQYFAQTFQSLVAASGMHPDSQIALMNMLRNEETRGLTIEELDEANPELHSDPDWAKIKQILLETRGY